VFNAKVIALDVNDEQLKLAAEMGADLTINSRSEDAAKIIHEKTGGAHAAVVTAVAKRRLTQRWMRFARVDAWWR
jgi:propanol-preferring alcohol dehydrogenase